MSTVIFLPFSSSHPAVVHLQPRVSGYTFFESEHNISWTGSDDLEYEIKLYTPSICKDYIVEDYLQPDGDVVAEARIDTVLRDLSNAENLASIWPIEMVLDTLVSAFREARQQLLRCESNPTSKSTLASLFGNTLVKPRDRSAIVPVVDANKGFFTATLIKGTAASLAFGLTATSIKLSDEDAKQTVSIIASGIALLVCLIVNQAVDYVKTQGDLSAIDAAVFKLFGDWATKLLRKTKAKIESKETCPTTAQRNQAISGFATRDNPLYESFDLQSQAKIDEQKNEDSQC